MTAPVVIVDGRINADGTLNVQEKLPLPPGPVQVTIVPVQNGSKKDPFWERMQAMWSAQAARGHIARTEKEIQAERQKVREEWDQRMDRIEKIQAEASRVRGVRDEGPA